MFFKTDLSPPGLNLFFRFLSQENQKKTSKGGKG